MDRTEKAEAVSSLNATLASAASVVVVRNLGMTVAQSTVLRQQMRDAGADFRVTKIGELLTGPTALATSTDPVAAAKIVVEFAKTNDKLEIVGGGMGDVVLDVNGVKALASLPSLDELRAKIIGLVQAPATKVAQIAAAPAGQLARVFGAYAAKEAA